MDKIVVVNAIFSVALAVYCLVMRSRYKGFVHTLEKELGQVRATLLSVVEWSKEISKWHVNTH